MHYHKGQLVQLKPLNNEMRQTLINLYGDVDIPEGLTSSMKSDMNNEKALTIISITSEAYEAYRLSDGNLWREECFTVVNQYSLEYI